MLSAELALVYIKPSQDALCNLSLTRVVTVLTMMKCQVPTAYKIRAPHGGRLPATCPPAGPLAPSQIHSALLHFVYSFVLSSYPGLAECCHYYYFLSIRCLHKGRLVMYHNSQVLPTLQSDIPSLPSTDHQRGTPARQRSFPLRPGSSPIPLASTPH